MAGTSEWEQLCVFCEGTGIDETNSYPASGPSYDSMGEPGHIEPCICQYDLVCSCGYGAAFGQVCVLWCGHGHYDGMCPPVHAELRVDG